MVGEDWDNWKECVAQDDRARPGQRHHLPDGAAVQHRLLQGTEGDRPATSRRSAVADWPTKRAWVRVRLRRVREGRLRGVQRHTVVKSKAKTRFVYREALWRGADMFGTGVASFGHVNGVHIQNVDTWEAYIEKLDAGELPLGRAFPTTRARPADPRDGAAAEDRPARRGLLPREVRRGRSRPSSAPRSTNWHATAG